MQADTTTLAPTDAEIDAAYRKVWSTIPHAKRLSAFAHEIAITLAARWGAPAPVSGEPAAEVISNLLEYATIKWLKANGDPDNARSYPVAGTMLYTAPPAQEARVPLSDEQVFSVAESHLPSKAHRLIYSTDPKYAEDVGIEPGTRWICSEVRPEHTLALVRAIEAAHGITAAHKAASNAG